jgi:hypothetical protein
MRTITTLASLLLALPLAATAASTYQVTGTVLEVKPKEIIVQKGEEKWSVETTDATKFVESPVAVGQKVTVKYKVVATTVDVRATAAADPAVPSHSGNVVTTTGKAAGDVVEGAGNIVGGTLNAAGNAIKGTGKAIENTADKIVTPNNP